MAKILLIDDHPDFCLSLQSMLKRMGYESRAAHSLAEGLDAVQMDDYDIIFLDVMLPDGNGLDSIDRFLAIRCKPEIIVLTADGDTQGAEKALRAGAWDYLVKPVRYEDVETMLHQSLRYRGARKEAVEAEGLVRDDIIGSSNKLEKCLSRLAEAAQGGGNVLLVGETGTGKELFARAVHRNSPRARNKFIVIDCTNLPKSLAESLLFGHEKGSFTGAQDTKEGLFKQADGGTIFLDEIGDLDLEVQKSLLRVLQERRFRPLSSKREVFSDFRLVAATNRDLGAMVRDGSFRKDLYYRLRAHAIDLPPLRERPEDIEPLVTHYLARFAAEDDEPAKIPSKDFLRVLKTYPWPGNVRELINVLQSSVRSAQREDMLYPYHFPLELRTFMAKTRVEEKEKPSPSAPDAPARPTAFHLSYAGPDVFPTLRAVRRNVIDEMERSYLRELVRLSGSSAGKACKLSGLSRARLYELLQKHGVSLR